MPAIHEVAYHFGISDELLDELGWRRGRQACVPRARLPVVGHLRLDGAFPGGAGRSYFSKLGSVFTEPTPHLELCRLNRPLTSRCVVSGCRSVPSATGHAIDLRESPPVSRPRRSVCPGSRRAELHGHMAIRPCAHMPIIRLRRLLRTTPRSPDRPAAPEGNGPPLAVADAGGPPATRPCDQLGRKGGAVQSARWTLREQVRFDLDRMTSAAWDGYRSSGSPRPMN